jgi:hypothetical protein
VRGGARAWGRTGARVWTPTIEAYRVVEISMTMGNLCHIGEKEIFYDPLMVFPIGGLFGSTQSIWNERV